MTDRPHVAIHASENMVVIGVGVRGVDERLHGCNRIVLLAEQTAIVIASMRISTKGRCMKYEGENLPYPATEGSGFIQRLIGLCEGGAVAGVDAVHLSVMPEAVRLCHNLLRLTHSAG
ncbi:MAG: hypothetical protein IJ718_07650, partial [Paludibacteraceae bacterium]|nr:hypothetical protein [Paludibacteraceae bacterium]